jgi:D-lactate dehydrogenase
MAALCPMVVQKYDGALKAEHGTGRNIAPFVELEWGAEAYAIMRAIKRLFDPNDLLNPGVVINDDREAHLKNLKPLPECDRWSTSASSAGSASRSVRRTS